MRSMIPCLALACAVIAGARGQQAPPAAAAKAPPLKVGVTLHPYYSWTRNVVRDTDIEVRSILPGDVDVDNYQPRPEDIKKLADLDALVVNGIGHDDVVKPMVAASGNAKLIWIRPNEGTPLIHGAHGEEVNAHTFLSFTNAIQQTYAIAKALGELRPELAAKFQVNAADYAKRLRKIKAAAAAQLLEPKTNRVVTVHDGYSYLLQEFGIEVAAVVQPAHGLTPSAAELADVIKVIRKEKVTILFSEEAFPAPLLDVLKRDAGAQVFIISHVATGAYSDDKFELEMKKNADVLVAALATGPKGS